MMSKFLLIFFFLTNIYAEDISSNDDDKDMIINKYDKCPNTPDGVCVDKDGCTQVIKRVINFNPSSSTIDENATTEAQNIIEIAQECFGYNIDIIGHTDSTYEANYNLNLSKQRTTNIQKLFLLHGINKERIKLNWFGETQPKSTNVSEEGRKINRRVEIIFK
jgi:OmpA-OmpF porin, OOP family